MRDGGQGLRPAADARGADGPPVPLVEAGDGRDRGRGEWGSGVLAGPDPHVTPYDLVDPTTAAVIAVELLASEQADLSATERRDVLAIMDRQIHRLAGVVHDLCDEPASWASG